MHARVSHQIRDIVEDRGMRMDGERSEGGRALKRILAGIGAVVGAVVLAFFVLGIGPRTEPLPESVETVQAGDPDIQGRVLRPYVANYRTSTRVLGVPIERASVEVSVSEAHDGLQATFAFGPGFADEMTLDRETLAPLRRGFPGQSFRFSGARVVAEVSREGEETTTRTFDFPGSVFEVTVLDLVLAAFGGELPARVAWDNFGAPDAWLAHVRERGTETVTLPGGAVLETRVVDVGFEDGRVRRFWIANEPPYKVKQRSFDRGRAIVTTWDLEGFETS